MAIPHFGHVELIQQCLTYGEYADIHLSGAEKNNDFDLRVLMLKHLCRIKNVDLSRVRFYNSPTVVEAMTFSVDIAPFHEVAGEARGKRRVNNNCLDSGVSVRTQQRDCFFAIRRAVVRTI